MNSNAWKFEVYVKGPKGETGWDIKVGYVRSAVNRQHAVSKIKAYFGVKYDQVIDCYYAAVTPLGCRTHTID